MHVSYQSSNDYLSLTHSQALRRRYLDRLEDCPDSLFGSTGSRLLDGTTPHHTALENRLASFFRYDFPVNHAGRPTSDTSALLFNSGYDANVSFFSTVPQRGDYIVHDELVHASVWDGMRGNARRGVAESHRYSFRHNSVDALEQVLREIVSLEEEQPESGMIYIGLESLYSMDGDLAPLEEILAMLDTMRKRCPRIINPKKVILILDEAHTTGISGRGGRGLAWHLQDYAGGSSPGGDRIATTKRVQDWCQVRVMTFGKAVGGQGGKCNLESTQLRPSTHARAGYRLCYSCTGGLSYHSTISHQLCQTFHLFDRHVGQQRYRNRERMGCPRKQ